MKPIDPNEKLFSDDDLDRMLAEENKPKTVTFDLEVRNKPVPPVRHELEAYEPKFDAAIIDDPAYGAHSGRFQFHKPMNGGYYDRPWVETMPLDVVHKFEKEFREYQPYPKDYMSKAPLSHVLDRHLMIRPKKADCTTEMSLDLSSFCLLGLRVGATIQIGGDTTAPALYEIHHIEGPTETVETVKLYMTKTKENR